MNQKKQVETKQQILNAFNAHFVISEDDVVVLTSTNLPVDEDFFQKLTRVKKIHHDCKLLFGAEDHTLGKEVHDQSSKQLNAAFQKLFRWIQQEFKTLDLENPQINASVRRAIRVLAERPALYTACLDSFAEARENILSDSFHAALTGASSNNTNIATKPIEFHAHDPLRYVGDMLAWVHSAAVSEREALEVLFISEGEEIKRSIQEGLESEPWLYTKGEGEAFDGRKSLNQTVSRALIGATRILRQRTDQVIQSQDDATLAYKIANLLRFYRSTFVKLLGEDSDVLDIFTAMEESALRQFRGSMRDYVATVQGDLTVASPDLSPPEFLEDALQMLRALAKSYDTSVASFDDREDGFQPVLAEALDPFLVGCENLQKGLRKPDSDIFPINCLVAVKTVLLGYTFTQERIEEIDDTVEEHVAHLITYQHDYLRSSSGLSSLLEALSDISDSADSISSIPTLDAFKPEALMASGQQLDEFLPSALLDAAENLKHLRNRTIVHKITEEAARRFCEDFEYIESKILAADDLLWGEQGLEDGEGSAAPALRDLFPRTSGEIRVLLS